MSDTTSPKLPALFRHTKRESWGLAVLAWERDGKRGYLFQDGALRIIAHDFARFMVEVDRPLSEVEDLLKRLAKEVGRRFEPSSDKKESPARVDAGLSFSDQMRIFETEYADGFVGAEWTKSIRGEGVKKRLKRHRDAAITQAQELLGQERLSELLTSDKHDTIWKDALAVLDATDLVPKAQLKPYRIEDATKVRALAEALVKHLHGDGDEQERHAHFLKQLREVSGKSVPWQVATALASLVHPANHVCIRPTSFQLQARSMAPRLPALSHASASSYARYLAMAKRIAAKLSDDALKPRDLMDVHDFVRLTTRPAAKKLLASLQASDEVAAATGDSAEAA